MSLSSLSVKRPVTITMIVLVTILLGAISLAKLPIDLFPEIEIPVAVVATSYTGAGPQEIENLITKRIEGAIATVSNIDTINSISTEGSSLVIAKFNYGTDMNFASLEMREKVDLIKRTLPEDANQPMVMKIDPNTMPIMQISLSTKGDLLGLQSLAEDTFSQRLERLDGVASVSVGGGFVEEVHIIVDQNQLSSYGLTTSQISQLLSTWNVNLPGGTVNKGDQEFTVRTVGEFSNIDDIKTTPITLTTGETIRLKDIADIKLATKDISSISRTNGKTSINMSIQKQSGKNTVQVSNLVNKEIEKLKKEYPNVNIEIIIDNSKIIKDSINTVAKNLILGSVLAIAILYIFLKNIRTTLIVGTSIPISVIASFALLYFNGITLNMMTLGGLSLAVGMLVDSAIVVLENIYRFRTEGYSKKEAAIQGAGEVGMAIVASTLTTIAVFIPIVFIDGIVGTIFKDFALTVTLSLAASLLVSLTFVPMLSSKILTVESDVEEAKRKKKKLQFLYNSFDRALGNIERLYKKLLVKSLKYRKTTVIISIVIFIVSMVSLAGVGMEFFPSTDEGTISINVKLPLGSKLEDVDEVANTIEEKLLNIKEIDVVFTNVGSGNVLQGNTSNSNEGNISVVLVKLNERSRSTDEVVEEIRSLTKDIAGAEISVKASSSTAAGMGGDPVSISIKGDELEILEQISNDFKNLIESVEGTRDVKTSISEAVPEVEVLIDKDIAATYGLTTAQIASAVRNTSSGTIATKYKEQGDEIDVIIKGPEYIKESLSNFKQIEIATPIGVNIPLSQVAELSVKKGPTQINRESQERVVTVTSQITGRDLRSISVDIDKKLQGYELPEGYNFNIGGENEEMIDAFMQLSLALLLAVILIYMVMAAQFESLIYPFIIMFTIPLAFSGGALALFITRSTLGVTAFIGVIMLAGIVVNNGIVLIDYINTLRNNGMDKLEAVTTAGPIRLRPILMTTLTTILGLLPSALGIGEGAEMQVPMAVVVIGGLTLSTVLTLVLVPTLYTIFDDASNSIKSKIRNKRQSISEA